MLRFFEFLARTSGKSVCIDESIRNLGRTPFDDSIHVLTCSEIDVPICLAILKVNGCDVSEKELPGGEPAFEARASSAKDGIRPGVSGSVLSPVTILLPTGNVPEEALGEALQSVGTTIPDLRTARPRGAALIVLGGWTQQVFSAKKAMLMAIEPSAAWFSEDFALPKGVGADALAVLLEGLFSEIATLEAGNWSCRASLDSTSGSAWKEKESAGRPYPWAPELLTRSAVVPGDKNDKITVTAKAGHVVNLVRRLLEDLQTQQKPPKLPVRMSSVRIVSSGIRRPAVYRARSVSVVDLAEQTAKRLAARPLSPSATPVRLVAYPELNCLFVQVDTDDFPNVSSIVGEGVREPERRLPK